MRYIPSYIKLLNSGELNQRVRKANKILEECVGCPHECSVQRTKGEIGICFSGSMPVVSSYTKHLGEEPVLSGTKGAGNIFFGNCNLRCVYCQNYDISQNFKSEKMNEVTIEKLADIMLKLQESGCHNIGLVSPTHFVVQILSAIKIAAENGLYLPIIYNSNGYDSVEMLKLLEGVIDIYLPDIKYGDNDSGKKYSKAPNYFDKAKLAVKEMYRQVGSLLIYEDNLVVRGLIIRHLVLPNGLAETENVFDFISKELDNKIHISLMSQYYPANKAEEEMLLSRQLRHNEYSKAVDLLDIYGLTNGWIQEMESSDFYRPQFETDRKNPFNHKLE